MTTYRCPTCNKILTKAEYEKALRIHGEREAHLAHREKELKRKERDQRAREREFKRGAKKKLQQETARVREQERLRAKRQQAGLKDTIQKLQERLRQRARGSTPQTEGLEFEDKLAARLEKEFPEDEILHKGKGGDVLHTVKFDKKPVGVIIYECKRTSSIQESHIVQTHKAKQTREADFAVLVTTGKKRGFSGFAQFRGVSVVSPLAVIPLVSLLREHLIEMGRLKITKEKRAVLAQQLMRYIDSPQFRNPLEEVVQRTLEHITNSKQSSTGNARGTAETDSSAEGFPASIACAEAALNIRLMHSNGLGRLQAALNGGVVHVSTCIC